MPNIPKKEFQEFPVGEIYSQRIDFSVDDHNFLMIFTPVLASGDEDYLNLRSQEVGFLIPKNSYDVKFDRAENFDSSDFYAPPTDGFSKIDFRKMARLGLGIKELLNLHLCTTKAEAYFAVAENPKLAIFYGRLARQYANGLQFEVTQFGNGGLSYAIKTSNYR